MSPGTLRRVHSIAGRVRFRSALPLDAEGAGALATALARVEGVIHTRVNARARSIIVDHRPDGTVDRLQDEVARVLDEWHGAFAPERIERHRAENGAFSPRGGAAAGLSLEPARWIRSLERTCAVLSGARVTSGPASGTRPERRPVGRSSGGGREDEAVFHHLELEAVLGILDVDPDRGLSEVECSRRRDVYGRNAIAPPSRRSDLSLLFGQLKSVPVALLVASAFLSAATGALPDAVAIFVVVGMNAGIGFLTERNTGRIIATLEKRGRLTARVLRGGVERTVSAEDLVPGDVLLLRPGSFVPADTRILAADSLVIDESALTGESMPVEKTPEALAAGVPLPDRSNMAYRGTLVTGGSGVGVVSSTGLRTELGQVQSLVGTVRAPQTPLQRELDELGVQLALLASGLCAGVFVAGVLRGFGLLTMLRTSISLAVAAVPEGLPTVAITTLSLGVRRLQARRVLVRELNAVETLGAIGVLCLDKTGTITENRMSVASFALGAAEGGDGALPTAELAAGSWFLRVLLLCSDVQLVRDGADTSVRGSPTETALARLALGAGVDGGAIRAEFPRLETQLRSEARSYMVTVHRGPGRTRVVAMKGRSPDVLARCDRVDGGQGARPLTDEDRLRIRAASEKMAGAALRVLGVAYAESETEGPDAQLVWLGLVGLSDPPRPGTRDVLARFHRAGIDTMMITGDQSATAFAVSRAIGLARRGRLDILDSAEMEKLPAEVLSHLARRVQVFSRVSPRHKLEIVRALQRAGKVVAMTGDGVNDSPAMKVANVGVAMGSAGTSAAREVADVVLENDDLGTLLEAIEQGRAIYDDIRQAVHFILATNASEILFMAVATALGRSQVLTPMQLLWINVLTDIFPELALAVQPPERDVLERKPRDPGKPMFARPELTRIALESGVITASALGAWGYAVTRYGAGARSSSVAFTTLTSAQLIHALGVRSKPAPGGGPQARGYVGSTVAACLGLQALAGLVPSLRRLLRTTPLGLGDWMVAALGGAAPLVSGRAARRASGSRGPGSYGGPR